MKKSSIISMLAVFGVGVCLLGNVMEYRWTEPSHRKTVHKELCGSITMAGSTAMEKFANIMAEGFMLQYPDVAVMVEFAGSSAGIESMLSGSADIANSSRNLREDEIIRGAVEHIVAIDGIAVVTDTANPVTSLTMEQLADIYMGKIRNWYEVGGVNEAIVVVGREEGSGTRDAFEQALGIEDKCVYANELDSTGAVMARAITIPGAIGYVSLDVLDDTVQVISIDGIAPTKENIKSGRYVLQRPFVMATKGELIKQSESVRLFFDYLKSEEGKRYMETVGLITPD